MDTTDVAVDNADAGGSISKPLVDNEKTSIESKVLVEDAALEDDSPKESRKVHEDNNGADKHCWPKMDSSVPFETAFQYRNEEDLAEMKPEDRENVHNGPLAKGELIDLSIFHEDDFAGKEKIIVDTLKQYGIYGDKPLIGVDLAFVEDLNLVVNGKPWDELKRLGRT